MPFGLSSPNWIDYDQARRAAKSLGIDTLGDYVDRGIDRRGVIDQLLMLSQRCRFVPLLGNHEEMMLGARESKRKFWIWTT
jgi:hypothetical protein